MKTKRTLLVGIGLFCLFLLFTLLVLTVDRAPIAPDGSEIGFATFNARVRTHLPFRESFLKVSDLFGNAAILVCLVNAAAGLTQWIKRKKLLLVDRELFCLGGVYIAAIFFYVLFTVVTVNVRPVYTDGVLEASYPSSHTILAVVVYVTCFFDLGKYLSKPFATVGRVLGYVLAALTVTTRILSGVHWGTDFVGSLLLAASLVVLLYAVNNELLRQNDVNCK